MIEKANAIEVFKKNILRTESLITAMEKIKAYNRLYQMNIEKSYPYNAKIDKQIQDKELSNIEKSCGEHAIISLVTAFETYYKELLQQLLSEYSTFFLSYKTKYTSKIHQLIEGENLFSYEQIEAKLELKNRFDYYRFFKEYSIPMLTLEEYEFIEYIYAIRNNFVHDAGNIDERTKKRLEKFPAPVFCSFISTESKKLRTKLKKLINKIDERIKSAILK